MYYMLVYQIEGAAGQYHRELSDLLAEQFRLRPVTEHIDPHLTLKAPFEAAPAQVEELLGVVRSVTQKESPQPLTLRGIGDFRQKIIYMDVAAPKQTHMLIRRLQDQFRKLPWLTFQKSEFPVTLHATLCRPKNEQQAKEILSYIAKKVPLQEFDLQLAAVTLLSKWGGKWREERRIPLAC